MQVLPRLETGGVERGTVDIADALTAAGRRAIVISAGRPMVQAVKRAGDCTLRYQLIAEPTQCEKCRCACHHHCQPQCRFTRVAITQHGARVRLPSAQAYLLSRHFTAPMSPTTLPEAYNAIMTGAIE